MKIQPASRKGAVRTAASGFMIPAVKP